MLNGDRRHVAPGVAHRGDPAELIDHFKQLAAEKAVLAVDVRVAQAPRELRDRIAHRLVADALYREFRNGFNHFLKIGEGRIHLADLDERRDLFRRVPGRRLEFLLRSLLKVRRDIALKDPDVSHFLNGSVVRIMKKNGFYDLARVRRNVEPQRLLHLAVGGEEA